MNGGIAYDCALRIYLAGLPWILCARNSPPALLAMVAPLRSPPSRTQLAILFSARLAPPFVHLVMVRRRSWDLSRCLERHSRRNWGTMSWAGRKSYRIGLVRELCGRRLERWGRKMGRIGGFVAGCTMRFAVGEGVDCSRRPLRARLAGTILQSGIISSERIGGNVSYSRKRVKWI